MAKTSQHTVWHYPQAVREQGNQGRIVEGHITLNGMVRYDAIRMERYRWELNE